MPRKCGWHMRCCLKRSMKNLKTLLCGTVLLGGLLASLQAATITYDFTGVIKNGNATPFNYFGFGSTFEATAVYDTSVAPTYNGPGGYGGQETNYPLLSLSMTVHTIANGDWTATSNNSLRNVDVLNDIYGDYVQFSAVGINAAAVAGLTANTFNISFGGSNLILGSTVVPTEFDLGLWDPYGFATQTYLKIYLNNFTQSVNFQILSVTSSDGPAAPVVPDTAATLPLLGLALTGLLLIRRRR